MPRSSLVRTHLIAAAGAVVAGLELTEMLAGAFNLTLLLLNVRDGRSLGRPRTPVRRAPMVHSGT